MSTSAKQLATVEDLFAIPEESRRHEPFEALPLQVAALFGDLDDPT